MIANSDSTFKTSPLHTCGQNTKTTTHSLLHCPNHHCERKTFFEKKNQVSGNTLKQSYSTIAKILLFGDNKLDFETNKILLMAAIKFILLAERFSFFLTCIFWPTSFNERIYFKINSFFYIITFSQCLCVLLLLYILYIYIYIAIYIYIINTWHWSFISLN